MQKVSVTKSKLPAWAKIAMGVVSVVLILITVLAYYATGFGYTVSRLRCGHKPFVKVGSFEPTNTYIGPDNLMYRDLASNAGSKYYCTEKQAQADGLFKRQ